MQQAIGALAIDISTPTYQKNIDGLRTIAVLSVIFYHLSQNIFSAGFIGVDVFFVISGYLISTHIINSLKIGNFSLKTFYTRRMRRILPALMMMLFITSVVAFFILMPVDLKTLTHSTLAATLSGSNLFFWRFIFLGYFAPNAHVLPILHTWSLGIEEQFYLVWPVTLFLLFHFLKPIQTKKWLGVITIFAAIFSFLLYYHFRQHIMLVFYSPVTRGFELLIGAILAIYWDTLKSPSHFLSLLLSVIGLFLIAYTASCCNSEDFPSPLILFPCIGTALLIYSGKTKNIINDLLSLKWVSSVGLISYSLYLWHWPLIAYANYLGITINAKIGIAIFLASFLLATLSFRYIEQPFRYRYLFSFKKTVFLFLIIPTILFSFFAFLCFIKPSLGFNKTDPHITEIISNFSGPLAKFKCFNETLSSLTPNPHCSIGDQKQSKQRVLLVGDSHAMAFAGMLDILLKNAHLQGNVITQAGSPFLILSNLSDWRANMPIKRDLLISKIIEKNHYRYVVMGGFWNAYTEKVLYENKHLSTTSYKTFQQGLDNAIKGIIQAGSIPVIIIDVPPLLQIPMQCGFTRLRLLHCFNDEETIKKIQKPSQNILLKMKEKYPELIFIDPMPVICEKNVCPSSIQGIPLYYTRGDNSHLNYRGSNLIGEIYLQHFRNPFIS